MQYQQDEKVLCFHGPLIYQAKILMAEEWKGDENQNGATGPHYFVHYQGWKKTWDEWVPQTRLLKYNEENLARQKALVDAQKAEAAAAAAVAAAQAAEKEQASRAKADIRKAGTPTNGSPATSTSRGSKRSRESADADEQDKRPDLRLTIPEPLKAQLVDDWENVTRKEQLVPLPRQPNVKQILDDYAAYYQSKAKATTRARSPAVLTEVLAGLKLYFDKSLAQNLLYRFERPQYVEMRKRHGPKMGDGDVQTEIAAAKPGGGRRGRTKASAAKDEGTPSPAPAPPSTLTELEASALYGAEHLLRLFVNLPSIVSHTTMDADSIAILREHVNEFLAFLAKEKDRLFVPEYEDPSPAYHRLSAI